MTESPDSSRAARDAFLALYREDLERDVERTLADYQRCFPGHEAEVAEEWRWLEPDPEPDETVELDGDAPLRDRTIGPYRVLGLLGRGAQATVYLAEHEGLRRRVALKVLHSSLLAQGTGAEQRFRREAEVTASVDHPGIGSVYEAGRSNGLTWIAMRFVPGQTVAQAMAAQQLGRDSAGTSGAPSGAPSGALELPADAASSDRDDASGSSVAGGIGAGGSGSRRSALMRVVHFVEQAARALHVAHERGLVHRDIKPGNLMIGEDGRPVVLDFGLARQGEDEGLALTRSSDVLGTPYYMAPEQLRGQAADVDRRSDVWALGVTLYECVTGRRPFGAPSREALYRQILTEEPVPVRALHPQVPRDLEVVLQTALEKDPDRRYQTALAFAEDLRRVRLFEPIAARPISPLGRVWRWARRHPAVALSATVAVLGLTTALVTSLVFQRRLADNLTQSRALGLAAASSAEIDRDPGRALRLALAAYDLAPDRIEAVSALHGAFARCREERVIPGTEQPTAADVTPDGRRLAYGSNSGLVHVHDRSGAELWEWKAPSENARSTEDLVCMQLAFLGPDLDRIAVGLRGGAVFLLDLAGNLRQTYATDARRRIGYPAEGCVSVGRARRHLLIGYADRPQLVRLADGGDALELVHEFEHSGMDAKWALHPDLAWVAMAEPGPSRGTLWRRTDAGDYEAVDPLLEESQVVSSLSFSGRRLAVGVAGAPSWCLDLTDPLQIGRTAFGNGDAEVIRWLGPDRIVGGRFGGQPKVWEVRDAGEDGGMGVELVAETPVRGLLTQHPVCPSPDGSRFAAGFQDGSIQVFDREGQVQMTLSGSLVMNTHFAFLDGGRKLWSAADNMRLWNLDLEREWLGVGGRLRYARGLDEPRLLAGWRLWGEDRSAPLAPARQTSVWGDPEFSPDGERLLLRQKSELLVLAARTGEELVRIPGPQATGPAIWLGNSQILRFDMDQRSSTLFDLKGDEPRQPRPGLPDCGAAWTAAASGDGRLVVVASRPGVLRSYERAADEVGDWVEVGRGRVRAVTRHLAISPDGRTVLAGDDVGRIYANDRRMRPLALPPEAFVGHQQRITDLRFSPDGALVASTSIDGTARLWRSADGTLVAVFPSERDATSCEFTPDGRFLLTVHLGGRQTAVTRRWFLDATELAAAARAIVQPWTRIERMRFAGLLGGDAEGEPRAAAGG